MRTLRFRAANPDDAEQVALLHADSWRRNYRGAFADSFLDGDLAADRLAVWSARLAAPTGTETTLAEDGDRLVGFVHVVLDDDPAWGSLVDNLHVTPTRQRAGIGTQLLARAAHAVTERAASDALYLWVLQQNAAAQRFYRASGGVCVETAAASPPGGEPTRLISYYDAEKKLNSRLAVIDRASGKKQSIFELPERGHVGGLAMSKTNLWVASSGTVSRISKPNLARAADGDRLPVDSKHKLAATSFATFDGKNLWVGKYEADADKARYAYRYPLGAGELPAKSYDRKAAIPTSVQGMAISGSRVLLSRPGGNGMDADSHLEIRPLRNPTGRPSNVITAPNMSEGVVIGNGKVHVLYESGAKKYARADYRVKTVHHGRASDLL